MAYEIEGKLLEVCSCNGLCPCWVGEDPDGGTCDSALAWHIDGGAVEGVDVSGRTVARAQLLRVFTGQLGGAIADLAGLIGEVVSVERVPITFTVDGAAAGH